MPPETTDARLAHLEHNLYDLSSRLHRSEEQTHFLQVKNQAALDTVGRLLHFNQELSRSLLSLMPVDSVAHRDGMFKNLPHKMAELLTVNAVVSLQTEMQRQTDVLRSLDESHEMPYGTARGYLGAVENAPVSPRQLAQDDGRRPAPGIAQMRAQPSYRPLVSSNLSSGSRRPYGSISGSSPSQSSPLRNANPAPPAAPHLLAPAEPLQANMGRRHTAADIRAHGWQPGSAPYPASNPPSAPWPSSPSRIPPEDQRLRESLSMYSLQTASHSHPRSRPSTPPPPASNGSNGQETFGSWTWGSAGRDGKVHPFKDSSAPPTRRGSMAHILNPSDTAERSDEDDDSRRDDDRKRKRLQ